MDCAYGRNIEGALHDEDGYTAVMETARDFAVVHKWPVQYIEETEASLRHARDDESQNYKEPVRGIIIHPHKNSEPLRLEFDKDLYI